MLLVRHSVWETVRMYTRIQKIGTDFALECFVHGLVANDSDRSIIENLQRTHDEFCKGSGTEKGTLSPKKRYAEQEADAYDPYDIETLSNDPT